jgi:hypothetical protein
MQYVDVISTYLSQALGGEDGCFNPTNPSVQKSMHCLLRCIIFLVTHPSLRRVSVLFP